MADDNGGAITPTDLALVVHNVRPRQLSAGSSQTGPEGTLVQLTGTFRDPGLADTLFSTFWVVTNPAGLAVASGFGTSFRFMPPDNSIYSATFTVTNPATGLSSSASTTVTTSNVNPTGVFTPPTYVPINEPATFSVLNPNDAGPGDVAAGLRFAFDFNNDGTFDSGDGTYSGSSASPNATTTFATPGPRTIVARVMDKDGGFTDYSAIVGAGARPAVQSVQINGGAVQRSRVTQITVTFDSVVNAAALANAFTLVRLADQSSVGMIGVSTSVVNGKTVAQLTVSGANTESGSLADGRYTLTVLAGQVSGSNGLTQASNHTTALHRLFGDINGDTAVNGFDLNNFRLAFGSTIGSPQYNSAFDFNQDGAVNGFDLNQFRSRFGIVLP